MPNRPSSSFSHFISAKLRWIKVDPTLEGLRKEPEFAKVLNDMGLPP
jgi:hypothetical protein